MRILSFTLIIIRCQLMTVSKLFEDHDVAID